MPDGPVATAKAALRSQVRRRRRDRDAQQRAEIATGLADRVLGLPEVAVLVAAGGGTVAAYASYRGEPGTGPLLDRLREAGVRVLLPVVTGPASLGWAEYAGPTTLAAYDRGIPEPVGPRLPGEGAAALLAARTRVVLVPATAVAADGIRLGQGGGYYDRLAEDLRRDGAHRPLLVALVHDDEVLPAGEVPHDDHDLVVDAVVTDRRVVRIGPGGPA